MPIMIENTTGSDAYVSAFLSDLAGHVVHVKIDVSLLTSDHVDSDGYLKPNTVFPSHGGAFGGATGTAQVETATVAGTIGAAGAGNVSVTITSKYYDEPLVIAVAVANDDTAAQVAGKIRTALAANTSVTNYFTVGGSSATVTLTDKTISANDTTLNIATATGTATGLTAAPTSANTTPGVAPDDAVMVIAPNKIAADNATETLSAITNDPLIACATHATVNRMIAEDNLGRAYTAVELTALKNSGIRFSPLK